VLRVIGAAVVGLVMYLVLSAAPFYPLWLASVIALAAAALALSSPALASPILVVAAALPLAAADVVIGATTLVLGLTTAWLLRGSGIGFLVVALVSVAVPLHAEWALAPIAGYLLGRNAGAGVGVAACLVIEGVGVLIGQPSIGGTATGGVSPGLIEVSQTPEAAWTLAWLPSAVSAADPKQLLQALGSVRDLALLWIQPLMWAVAAVVGSTFRKPPGGIRALGGVSAGVAFLTISMVLLDRSLGGPVTFGTHALVAVVSLAVSLGVASAAEWVFPVVRKKRAVAPHGMRAEDAEVDELLRLIASAESQLAHRHQTQAVVLITDMKSFSAMTEEIGSLEVAKVVQRHRDLLLPVIERHKGKGKSTGGDGLLAAFSSAQDAAEAAIDMERTLAEFCRSEPLAKELLIRVGIARGEVVLDSGGRPFLGAGLNLAARVMNLADGGHVMATAEVARASRLPDTKLHDHGSFELKNIAEPVEVVELLWLEEMEPQPM